MLVSLMITNSPAFGLEKYPERGDSYLTIRQTLWLVFDEDRRPETPRRSRKGRGAEWATLMNDSMFGLRAIGNIMGDEVGR